MTFVLTPTGMTVLLLSPIGAKFQDRKEPPEISGGSCLEKATEIAVGE